MNTTKKPKFQLTTVQWCYPNVDCSHENWIFRKNNFGKIYKAEMRRQFRESGDFPFEDRYMNA